jgi:hypothetical protein
MKQKTKFNYTFVKFLLRALLVIVASFILLNTVNKAYFAKPEGIRIIQQDEQIASAKYIISEKMIMDKLQQKSQIVSLQQNLHKKDTLVDDSWMGERHTELSINGTYIMGLETKDIIIKHIDNENGILYIKLPEPKLISLEIPYDEIEFDKTQGFFRLAMNEEEQKTFYKAVEKNIRNELMSDEELLRQADVFNKDAVMDIMKLIPEIKSVVFE